MQWRKFSEKKPKENEEIYIRSFPWKTFHHEKRVSFSSDTLWLGGELALCQKHYEWLDEEEEKPCRVCGK